MVVNRVREVEVEVHLSSIVKNQAGEQNKVAEVRNTMIITNTTVHGVSYREQTCSECSKRVNDVCMGTMPYITLYRFYAGIVKWQINVIQRECKILGEAR